MGGSNHGGNLNFLVKIADKLHDMGLILVDNIVIIADFYLQRCHSGNQHKAEDIHLDRLSLRIFWSQHCLMEACNLR